MKQSNFQLIGLPKVSKLNYQLDFSFESKGKIPLTIHNNVKVLKNDYETNKAKVVLNLTLFKDKEQKPFTLEAEIFGYFNWESGIYTNEQLENLLYENAPAMLLSYLRSLVSQITTYSGISPLVLPLMNFRREAK